MISGKRLGHFHRHFRYTRHKMFLFHRSRSARVRLQYRFGWGGKTGLNYDVSDAGVEHLLSLYADQTMPGHHRLVGCAYYRIYLCLGLLLPYGESNCPRTRHGITSRYRKPNLISKETLSDTGERTRKQKPLIDTGQVLHDCNALRVECGARHHLNDHTR